MIYDVVFSDGRIEKMALSIDEVAEILKRNDVESVSGLKDEREIDTIAKKLTNQ
ncbi:hypothetical protein [Serratia marcescens]|uniref:hypothetical protein n=1 Tax=Serratia marcescens TaxID=615 RepID=UPI000B0A6DF1|nr:hypothetical protein [Serratia marcescens]BEN87051.1 hypothetical protein SMQC07_08500 [Serratia marcescens]BEN92238.1 hypothetical protein SMQC08_08510 [Serratia marcescens]BEN97564.1 hypothetical protein SMQC11_08530 [Serratia marcescens]